MASEIGHKTDVYGSNIIIWRLTLCEQQEVPLGPLAAPALRLLPTAEED